MSRRLLGVSKWLWGDLEDARRVLCRTTASTHRPHEKQTDLPRISEAPQCLSREPELDSQISALNLNISGNLLLSGSCPLPDGSRALGEPVLEPRVALGTLGLGV